MHPIAASIDPVRRRVRTLATMNTTAWHRSAAASQRYADRFIQLERDGADLHGEARLVDALVPRNAAVLDAGCGTGRVGAELARRGHRVSAVDLDPVLIEHARTNPDLDVQRDDLATVRLAATFDAVVLAGNVMVFLAPGSESAVIENLVGHLRPGGVLIAGFATDRPYALAQFHREVHDAGLVVEHTFSTWDMRPWHDDADWAVTIARYLSEAGDTVDE